MTLKWEISEPRPKCEEARAKSGKVKCELPPGHDDRHLGRDAAGRWHSW